MPDDDTPRPLQLTIRRYEDSDHDDVWIQEEKNLTRCHARSTVCPAGKAVICLAKHWPNFWKQFQCIYH